MASNMHALRRFYLSENPSTNDIRLDQKQSHHLGKVLRLKPGSRIEVFSPNGKSYLAQIAKIDKAGAQLKILDTSGAVKNTASSRISLPHITLATAIPKSKRMDVLVDHVAELGLNRLIPLNTQRSVIRISSSQNPKFHRWKRIAVEAAKQSGQNHVLEIAEPIRFSDLVKQIHNYDLALMGTLTSQSYLPDVLKRLSSPSKILYCIGPEGDFTPEEIKEAETAGIKSVLMAISGTLRTETAAAAMLAMLLYACSQINVGTKDTK